MNTSLEGRLALVTGASSGIGCEVARRLCASGMKVAGCARRQDRLAELAAELGDAFMPISCDLSDLEATIRMCDEARRQLGGVDVLINNAGFGRNEPLRTAPSPASKLADSPNTRSNSDTAPSEMSGVIADCADRASVGMATGRASKRMRADAAMVGRR